MLGFGPAYGAVDFDREIRPILSDNCFSCHGPDSQKRMANLRLDTIDGGAFANGVIVPGKSAESRLYNRISTTDKAKHLPPVYSGRALTPQQMELVKQWIAKPISASPSCPTCTCSILSSCNSPSIWSASARYPCDSSYWRRSS
jgi:hypothetical protein